MKRIILFSLPSDQILKKISKSLFFKTQTQFGYMPCDGANQDNPQYTPIWEELCRIHNARLIYIDNTNPEQAALIPKCDTLMITGGNTFQLLHNLRKNGFDKAIIDFTKKDNFALSGFSAGAVVLTPTINIVNANWAFGPDENLLNLTDLQGLNIIDYEVLPHFDPDQDKTLLGRYRSESKYHVKTITNEEYLIDNLKEDRKVGK
ncbi:MAG: Type 1 glutamine amidotransferase-like domain-containing protein [bacterium]